MRRDSKPSLETTGDNSSHLFCCEIDPLTRTGHCYQLLCMIGLPAIPVMALVAYSSLKLAGVSHELDSLGQLGGIFDPIASTRAIVEALQEEMTGVVSIATYNGSGIIGSSLVEFYETTNVALESVQSWPQVEASSEMTSREAFQRFLNEAHLNESSLSSATVLSVLDFYTNIIEKFLYAVSQLILLRTDPVIWANMYALDNLLHCVSRLGVVRALGSVYYFNGQLTGQQLAVFLSNKELASDDLKTAQKFNSMILASFTTMKQESPEFWKSLAAIESKIEINQPTSRSVADGLIWSGKSRAQMNFIGQLIDVAGSGIKDHISDREDTKRHLMAFYVASILVMLLCMFPVSVSTAMSTIGSLRSYIQTMERKSNEIKREKRKTERLLNEMLPRAVAYRLRKGELIEAEQYQSVTILFSDIADFTDISINSVPFDIVIFLNDLYNFIDAQIVMYDAYKVETISCVYMVSSGIPSRNGERHAIEIARLALDLMKATDNFVIPHMPGHQLQLRIGAHTGPVVGGVVGNKMPRYCLFGDTVNTASRMQSSGLPRKIHISESTSRSLNQIGGFRMELRGEVDIKGKGTMVTYWLLGKEEVSKVSRMSDPKWLEVQQNSAEEEARPAQAGDSSQLPSV